MKILGKYQIIYWNGIKQVKNLIDHEDYINHIKPIYFKIDELEIIKKNKEAKLLKKELKDTYGESWFTDKSPLFEAISTSYLNLPNNQGGIRECKVSLF